LSNENQKSVNWFDVVWLLFLAGLAALPPLSEVHKQLTLGAIGVLQVFENRLVRWLPRRGRSESVLLKILLSTLLLAHTGGPGINSNYYPIYYLPVVTAAMYFGPWATIGWTALASAMYCSFLWPALQEYELTAAGITILIIRILFFFLAALLVNRFALENRRQTARAEHVARELASTLRQLEKAQAETRRTERLAALGQLSAGLAHEIRNPLGVIRGSAEMLSQKLRGDNPLTAELAEYILSETNRVSMMVSRFLDFARPLRLEKTRQNVATLADRALKTVAEQMPESKVAVERSYGDGLPEVQLDQALCEQALENLVRNAYEAMGDGGGTLRVTTAAVRTNGRAGAELRFTDTGPGIPAELHEQVFNPFVTTKKTGTGLGLSLVSKIVDEHRGTIRLESAPGGGACFIVFFPADDEPAEAGKEAAAVSS
jgi:signal transduction histidine kinase